MVRSEQNERYGGARVMVNLPNPSLVLRSLLDVDEVEQESHADAKVKKDTSVPITPPLRRLRN